jgi:hypothetical protein
MKTPQQDVDVKSGHERGCEAWCAANVTSYSTEEEE